MGLISELRKSELADTLKMQHCLCCGEVPKYGGFYCGPVELALCADCVLIDDTLSWFGILVGDAVLDLYKHQFCGTCETLHPPMIVDRILGQLEKSIYRTLTVGWFTRNREKYGTGLRHE